jgi:hypothetical protein
MSEVEGPNMRVHPTLEGMAAALQHLIVVQAVDSQRITRLEDELHKFVVEGRALKKVALSLSTTALQLQMSRVMSAVAPTFAQFVLVGGASFAGGLVAQLLLHLSALVPMASR